MQNVSQNRIEHVVFFPGQDGGPAFRRMPSLDEAVRFVEHLRNIEGVSDVSVYALAEVPVAFRPYYRVEVGAAASVETPATVDEAAAVVEDAPEPAEAAAEGNLEEMVPSSREESREEPSPNGRRGLAFFAS